MYVCISKCVSVSVYQYVCISMYVLLSVYQWVCISMGVLVLCVSVNVQANRCQFVSNIVWTVVIPETLPLKN